MALEVPDFSLMGNKNLPPIVNTKKQPGNNKPIQNTTIELPMNKVKYFFLKKLQNAKIPYFNEKKKKKKYSIDHPRTSIWIEQAEGRKRGAPSLEGDHWEKLQPSHER